MSLIQFLSDNLFDHHLQFGIPQQEKNKKWNKCARSQSMTFPSLS